MAEMFLDADYIIAGAGCAGLSLAVQLKRSGLPFSKVIIIDKEQKTKNDRTWCFWTSENKNWFDAIVLKKWDHFEFRCGTFRKIFDLEPYRYQMIRGIDFYEYCREELAKDNRFEFIYDKIISISANSTEANLTAGNMTLKAKILFNSVIQTLDIKPRHINYVQHFRGWLIETEQGIFNENMPVFMDFEDNQSKDCRFFYLIPYSRTKALVEYTGFSKHTWDAQVYDKAIGDYMNRNFHGTAFRITEMEYGRIPMYESAFINPYGPRIVNIGSAGGNSKPSTGYTFYFIQKHTQEIIAALRENKLPVAFKRPGRFSLYDKILLGVLDQKKLLASKIFMDLFRKNNVKDILDFLNEESTIWQELKIMNTVDKVHFIKAALTRLV